MVRLEHPRVVVFDFDGTLVDSNAPKREAFFQLFPDRTAQHPVVEAVLREYGDASRYVILREVLARLEEHDGDEVTRKVEELAARYNELAFQAASTCPEMPGASALLARLAESYKLYVSSGTPVEPLRSLVARRGWRQHLEDVFGYPAAKSDTLRAILERESCEPAAALVVGDGDSDERSAAETGCGFFAISSRDSLAQLAGALT